MQVRVITVCLCLGFSFCFGSLCFATDQSKTESQVDVQGAQVIEPKGAKKKMATIPKTEEEKLFDLYDKKTPEKPAEMAKIPDPEGEPAMPKHRKKAPEPTDEMAVIP